MSQWIRKLLMGQPMSRREFLSGTAGAAAAAAASRVPVPAPQAEAAARALSHADMLPSAFHSGFSLPTGAYIVGRDGDAMIWGYDGGHQPKADIEHLESIAREAAASLGKMPRSDVPLHYNHLTRQWHALGVFDETPDGYRRTTYLKQGVLPPPGREQGDWNVFDEDFAAAAHSEGTLTRPGLATVSHRARASKPIKARELISGEITNQPVPPYVKAGDATKKVPTQIDAIRAEWESTQRAIADYYRTNPPKDDYGREMRLQVNENMGYAPGGWHNAGPDPFPVNELGIGATEPLDGGRPERQSASPESRPAMRRARQMLMYGVPAAAVGAQQQQGPVAQELLK